MRIRLISHASVIIDSGDARIWTDPWLSSKVFNDSWNMLPEPAWDDQLLDGIDYLWISHEHPDHFNLPTLRALPAAFKERVTVLFQQKHTEKLFDTMRKLGYRRFESLPNRRILRLRGATEIYCYQVGIMDSCLGVRRHGQTVFNINDAELNRRDCRLILKDLHEVDVVLNQFSIAGYLGYADYATHLSRSARIHLERFCSNLVDLEAEHAIPIASFMYYCCEDNRYANRFHNSLRQIQKRIGDRCVALYPGDEWTVGAPHDSEPALRRFDAAQAGRDQLPYDAPTHVQLSEIENAFHIAAERLHQNHPWALLKLLQPVTVEVPDLDLSVRFSISERRFEVAGGEPDLTINSQPLHYSLRWPWGVQTLGSSARYVLRRNFRNWRWHRIVFSLSNGEIFLKPSLLFTRHTLEYIGSRLEGGPSQLLGKLARMK